MLLQSIDPSYYPYARALYATISLLWGSLWAMVAWHYGVAAYVSWRASGGRWTRVPAEVLDPFLWAVRCQLSRWRLIRSDIACQTEIPIHYSPGNLLRFAIFVGSLTPSSFGLLLAFSNRVDQALGRWLIIYVFIFFSVTAAGGHLFLAYRRQPDAWRRLVIWSSLWILISPFMFYYIL